MINLNHCPFCGSNNVRPMRPPYSNGYLVFCTVCGANTSIYGTLELAVTAWNRRSSGLRPAGWTSVGEALPEPFETVMISVLTRNGYGEQTRYETIGSYSHVGERWMSFTGNIAIGEIVTHWQPMPEPPKEDIG